MISRIINKARFVSFEKKQDGQSLVEFALLLPILLVIVFGIIQFGVILNGQVTVTSAAREGARSAVVGNSEAYVTDRILDASTALLLDKNSIVITFDPADLNSISYGDELKVTVEGNVPIIVPFMGAIFSNAVNNQYQVSSTASMRVE